MNSESGIIRLKFLDEKAQFRPLQPRKAKKGWRKILKEVGAQVRSIFIILFAAAIFVFVFAKRTEVEQLSAAQFHRAATHIQTDSGFRRNALRHEEEVQRVLE